MADNKVSINIKANMDADSISNGLNKIADGASRAQSELSGLQKAGEDATDVFEGMNFDDFFVDEDEIEETIDDVKKLGNEAKNTKSELDGVKKSIDNIGNSKSSGSTSELGDLNEIYRNIMAATEARKQAEEEEKEEQKRRAAEKRESARISAAEAKRLAKDEADAFKMARALEADEEKKAAEEKRESAKERDHLRKKELADQKSKLEQERHDHRIAELEKREEIRRTADEERQRAKEAADEKKKADKEAAEVKKKEAKEAAEAEKKAAEEAAAATKAADEERVRKAREHFSTMRQLEKALNEIENSSGNQRNDWLDSLNNSLRSLGDGLPALEKEINKQFEDTGNYVEVIVDNIDNMTEGLTKFDAFLTKTKEKWGDLAGIKYEPEFWPESFDNNIDAGSWKIDKQGLNLDTSNPELGGVVEAVSEVSNSMDAVNSKIQRSEELVGNIEKIFPNLSKYVDMSVDSSGAIVANLDAVSAGMAVLKEVAKIVSKYFDDWDKTFDKVVDSSTLLVSSLGEGLKNSLNNILELCGDVGEALVNGFDNAVDLIGQLITELENAASKVKDLADTGVELTNKWFKLSRILGSENASDGSTVLGSLSSLYNLDADNLIDGFNSIEMMLTKIGASSKESASAIGKLMLDLSAASNEDFSSIAEKVNSAITMGYIGNNNIVTRLLFNTEAEKKAFKSLSTEAERAAFIFNRMSRVQGAMAEYMNTSAGKVRQLNESISSLNGNVSRLAMGLLAQLAPVLTKIIQLVDYAVQRLTQLLGLNIAAFGGGDFGGLAVDGGTGADALSGNSSNSGSGNSSSKKDKAAKKNKELAKSIKEVDQAAKEAQRSVASFDDVIQLPENKETIADSLDGLEDIDPETLDDLEDIVDTLAELGENPLFNNGLNFGNLLPNDLDKKFEKFKDSLKEIFDLMEKNKFFEAGQKLNKLLQELLSDIPWDKIQEKAASAGEHIAEFLNGLFKDEALGYKIGENLAETINTAFEFLYKIITGTNFEEIGEFISESVIGFFENIDAEKIGGSIIGAFNDVVDFVIGAVKNLWEKRVFEDVPAEIDTGIELIAYKISEFLNTIIDGFDPERTLTAVTAALDEILIGIMTFTDNLKYEELGDKLWTFFSGAFDYVVDRFNLLFPVLVEGIVKNINSIFTKLDGKKLGQQLGSVISTVISSIGRIINEIDWSEIGSDIGATLQGILENIDPVEAANNILDLISSILEMVGSMLQEIDTEELVSKVKAFFERLFTGFAENKEQWAGVISKFSTLFINLIDAFFGAVDSTHLVSTIQTFLEQAGIFDAISRWVEAEWQVKIDAWFIKMWGKLSGKLGEFIDNIVIPGLLTLLLGPVGPLASLAWVFKDKIEKFFSDTWDAIKGFIFGTTSKSEDELENDSAEAGERMVGSIENNIGKVLIKWLDDHGFNITKKVKEAGKSIKDAINGIIDVLKQTWQSFKTKAGNAWDKVSEFCDKVKTTFTNLVNKVKEIFDISSWIDVGMGWINNIKAGIAQAWNDLVDWIRENIHLPEINIKLPSFLKSPSVDVQVPKLATGGIVTSSTIANIGEAGPEAILPLTDSSWMDSLAEKIAAGINSGDASERQVNIDLNSFTKPYYSQAEMLEFGRQVVQGLQLVGVNVSTV